MKQLFLILSLAAALNAEPLSTEDSLLVVFGYELPDWANKLNVKENPLNFDTKEFPFKRINPGVMPWLMAILMDHETKFTFSVRINALMLFSMHGNDADQGWLESYLYEYLPKNIKALNNLYGYKDKEMYFIDNGFQALARLNARLAFQTKPYDDMKYSNLFGYFYKNQHWQELSKQYKKDFDFEISNTSIESLGRSFIASAKSYMQDIQVKNKLREPPAQELFYSNTHKKIFKTIMNNKVSRYKVFMKGQASEQQMQLYRKKYSPLVKAFMKSHKEPKHEAWIKRGIIQAEMQQDDEALEKFTLYYLELMRAKSKKGNQ